MFRTLSRFLGRSTMSDSHLQQAPPQSTIKRVDVVVLFLLTVSLGLNLVLGLGAYARYEKAAEASRKAAGLKEGSSVADFVARRIGGDKEVVRRGKDVPTILYFHSSSCGWCERNLPNLRYI